MQLFLPFIAFFLLSIYSHAQTERTVYFDENWKVVNSNDGYTYYRKVNVDDQGNPVGKVRTYYLSTGALQWIGEFKSKDIECTNCEECKCEGLCSWFSDKGQKTSEAHYENGRVIGEQKYWDERGNPIDISDQINSAIASAEVLKQLLEHNIKTGDYDPLQGIWNVTTDLQFFLDGRLLSNKITYSKKGILKARGEYEAFAVNEGKSGLKFIETAQLGKYRVSLNDGKYTHAGTGILTEDLKLKVVIEVNKNLIRNALNTYDVTGIDAFYEMTFTKMYPLKDQVDEIVRRAIEEAPRTATGFALFESGVVATNHHVVENAKSIKIRGIKGDFSVALPAKVILEDRYNDIAILKIDDAHFKGLGEIPYRVKTIGSDVGEDIFVLGYPLTATMGEEVKLTTGVVSSRTGFQGSVSQYQISAPIQPGNSGGPLFDKGGNIIGIVSSKHRETDNVGYAIKASFLLNLVDLLPDKFGNAGSVLVSNNKLSEQVKILRNYVYIIEVNKDL